MSYLTAYAACILGPLAVLFIFKRSERQSSKLPPGPPGLPLIGNLLDMPRDQKTWLSFAQWGEQYGDICSISIFGQRIVILNSVKMANEMLAGKSALYSDRPRLVMAAELSGWGRALALHRYDNRWREIRRLFQQAVGTHAALKKFNPGKEFEARRFVKSLIERPDDLLAHLQYTAGATILRDTYGYEASASSSFSEPDSFIVMGQVALQQFSKAADPAGYLVDFIPALRFLPSWFPGMGFKRDAKFFHETVDKMATVPVEWTKEQMKLGTANPSFVSTLLEDSTIEEDPIKWSAVSLFSGANDTTVGAIYAFFLAMTLNPDVVAKAHRELDSVIGKDHLPTVKDRSRLPYVDALVKEVLRWHTVVPSPPHYTTEDDVHGGYLIPKGTIVFPNIWQMMHDTDVYVDPFKFNPERFLGSVPEPDPKTAAFGFGRRICPGMYFADDSVFITCATSLAVLNIEKATDEFTGKVIEPVLDMQPGMISHTSAFRCRINPRDQRVYDMVAASL